VGPWLVTRDEIPDLGACELKTTLNGEVMQLASVSDLLFDVPTLIAYCSTFTPLRTGDIIVTGTTGGVGVARNPQVWMKSGDVVSVSVSGVGELINPIVDESAV
jgi:2-keto-4-pentenoate hydratase/2-oxohepta-3-ene-1,7-dioic acid hydratase in catechol pathway